MHTVRRFAVAVITLVAAGPLMLDAQSGRRLGDVDASIFAELAWRSIGPFTGARVVAGVGTAATTTVFYTAVADGGVLKTTDAGRSWRPIFDAQGLSDVVAIATVPSEPDVVYAAVGGGPPRAGVFRSADAGQTWSRVEAAGSASQIAISSDGRNTWLVPASNEPSTSLLKSTDGGRTFETMLVASDVRVESVVLDPLDVGYVYAVASRQPTASAGVSGRGSDVYMSRDGGHAWHLMELSPSGSDANRPAVMALAASPADHRRLVALTRTLDAVELYRSDDQGVTWIPTWREPDDRPPPDRAITLTLDPFNKDIVFLVSDGVRRSTDGGQTFSPWGNLPSNLGRAALWLHPSRPGVGLLTTLHGAVITLNGGDSWSSSENQTATGFDRVVADSAFPYRVCGTGVGTALVCVPSRRDSGSTPEVVSVESLGSVAIDPGDPDVIYSGGVRKYDRRTGQALDASPPGAREHSLAEWAPLLFGGGSSSALYYAAQTVWKSTTGGQTWTSIGPQAVSLAGISALSVSPIDGRILWMGTRDGTVSVTRDGGLSWTSPTRPVPVSPAGRIATVEASHFDLNMAYVTVDDGTSHPRVLKTRDGGATWTEATRGLPAFGRIRVVREDPYRRGLLIAGGEAGVSVSFDDGEFWQSLQLNLPVTTVTDLTTKDTDLVIATSGRGLWILDDISPLRQVTADIARADVFLLRPPTAWRMRAPVPVSSPLSPAAVTAQDAAEGVAISYVLGQVPTSDVIIEIVQGVTGDVIRRYMTTTATRAITPGVHHVTWDLRYTPRLPATPALSPALTRGLRVAPGTYQVRLTAGARVLRQAVTVRLDPRIKASQTDLATQLTLLRTLTDTMVQLANARIALGPGTPGMAVLLSAPPAQMAKLAAIDRSIFEVNTLVATVEGADVRPTSTIETAVLDALERARQALALEP